VAGRPLISARLNQEAKSGAGDGWRCPQCGRRFRRRTREHSCDVRSLAAHVDRGSPQVKELVGVVLGAFARLGPHAVVPLKTMIVVRTASNFASLVVRRETLEVGFILPRNLTHQRIHKTERLAPEKYAHHTRLSSPADIDKQLAAWLREAYEGAVRVT
jgi:hypothetical protein